MVKWNGSAFKGDPHQTAAESRVSCSHHLSLSLSVNLTHTSTQPFLLLFLLLELTVKALVLVPPLHHRPSHSHAHTAKQTKAKLRFRCPPQATGRGRARSFASTGGAWHRHPQEWELGPPLQERAADPPPSTTSGGGVDRWATAGRERRMPSSRRTPKVFFASSDLISWGISRWLFSWDAGCWDGISGWMIWISSKNLILVVISRFPLISWLVGSVGNWQKHCLSFLLYMMTYVIGTFGWVFWLQMFILVRAIPNRHFGTLRFRFD